MVEALSPLGAAWRPGRFGAPGALGATLGETKPGSIVQVAAWPGEEARALAGIAGAVGITVEDRPGAGAVGDGAAVFGFAPGRFLVVADAEGGAEALRTAIDAEVGTVTDLSHGRTAFRVEGPKAEWVLAKLFAVDFALAAFPVGEGRATAHHEVSALIQRAGEQAFDLYVFRSFARSFWKSLCRAAEETGYEVV